jgi:hypothetical protein
MQQEIKQTEKQKNVAELSKIDTKPAAPQPQKRTKQRRFQKEPVQKTRDDIKATVQHRIMMKHRRDFEYYGGIQRAGAPYYISSTAVSPDARANLANHLRASINTSSPTQQLMSPSITATSPYFIQMASPGGYGYSAGQISPGGKKVEEQFDVVPVWPQTPINAKAPAYGYQLSSPTTLWPYQAHADLPIGGIAGGIENSTSPEPHGKRRRGSDSSDSKYAQASQNDAYAFDSPTRSFFSAVSPTAEWSFGGLPWPTPGKANGK